MTTNKPEVFEVYRTRQGTLENVVLLAEYEALQAECEELRKDAERYRYIKKGNQWVVAATKTGFHLDGEELDDLMDSEMEQQA